MVNKKESQQEKYNKFLKELLETKLFDSGNNIHDNLIKTFGITPDNSRKIVSRAVLNKAISSSKPYTFGKGQFIYLCNTQELNIDAIKKISAISRPPIYRLLELLDQNYGIVSFYEGLKITASPLIKSSTKADSLDDILKILKKLNLIYTKKDSNSIIYIILTDRGAELSAVRENFLMINHYSKMVGDCNLIPDILKWLIKSNIIDNNNIIYRNKKTPSIGAKHNNLIWDAFAYTRSTGINKVLGAKADSIEKQTLVVLDIILSEDYSNIHFDAFLSRIQINRNSVIESERKIFPIIIYRKCSLEIFNKIRKNGIVSFDISSIFGTKIFDIISKTSELHLLIYNDQGIEETVASIFKKIKSAGQEDALGNLRGTLFEYLMYPFLKNLYSDATISQNVILKDDNDKYEYDFIIKSEHPSEIILVEVKGIREGTYIQVGDLTEAATLKYFFNGAVPFARKKLNNELSNNKKLKAIYITSGGYWDPDDFIARTNQSKIKSLKINAIIDRIELIKLLKSNGFESEIKTIKQYYSDPNKVKKPKNREKKISSENEFNNEIDDILNGIY